MRRTIKITNIYDEENQVVNTEQVDLRDRAEFDSGESWEAYLEEVLWPLTGAGRDGETGYFIESTDGLEPPINLEWC